MLLAIFAFKDLLYQPCFVPSCSMYKTFLIGDVYLARKVGVGYTNSSFDITRKLFDWFGITTFTGRILGGEKISAGTAVVIHGKTGIYKGKLILKRIIATAGQKVELIRGDIYIDGVKLQKENLGIEKIIDKDGEQIGMMQKESINGKEYKIFKQDLSGLDSIDNMEFTVPENHVFVMGDNRDRSADSRIVGFIHEDDIIAIASFMLLSFDTSKFKFFEIWKVFSCFRFDRFFTKIS